MLTQIILTRKFPFNIVLILLDEHNKHNKRVAIIHETKNITHSSTAIRTTNYGDYNTFINTSTL